MSKARSRPQASYAVRKREAIKWEQAAVAFFQNAMKQSPIAVAFPAKYSDAKLWREKLRKDLYITLRLFKKKTGKESTERSGYIRT